MDRDDKKQTTQPDGNNLSTYYLFVHPRPLQLPPMATAKPACVPPSRPSPPTIILACSRTHPRCLLALAPALGSFFRLHSRPFLPTAARDLEAIQKDEETEKDSERQERMPTKITGRKITRLPRHVNPMIGDGHGHGHFHGGPVCQNQGRESNYC